MNSLPPNANVCPQCGKVGAGKYCAFCGTLLETEKESVSEEIRSKFTSPLVAALSFAKAVWLTWISPVRFLRSCFTGVPPLSELPFPLSSVWRLVDPGPQKVSSPFSSLAFAIVLVSVLGSLEQAAWRVNDFGERLFGESQSEMRERGEARLKEYYQSEYGRSLHFVDSDHLTGIAIIDRPLEEIFGLLNYAFFAIVAVFVLARGNVKGHRFTEAYVYLISAAIAASAVLSALGLVVFSLGAAAESIGTVALSGFGQLAGYLLVVYFVVILPIVILPKVLDVSKSKVVVATCVATGTWLLARFLFFSVLQWQLGIIVR
jgi:hypothetical protein